MTALMLAPEVPTLATVGLLREVDAFPFQPLELFACWARVLQMPVRPLFHKLQNQAVILRTLYTVSLYRATEHSERVR
jgi:hypothetical protein